jgi:DNA helicase II / ATP-dependent DNA helicase PcrA
VSFVPDNVEELEDGSVDIERLRTGRPTRSELDDEIYALYAAGAEGALGPSVPARIQVHYLATDQVQEVTLKPRAISTRLAKYDRAMVGILNEAFPPEPSDRTCPRCPHYFICPSGQRC